MDYLSYYKKYLYYKAAIYKKVIEHNYDPVKSPWWDYVTPEIVLGAIPLKNYDHLDTLVNFHNVGYVLSILDNFELETDTYVSCPIRPHDWSTNGIISGVINSPDYQPLSMDNLTTAVKFVEEHANKGKRIYIHCKYGHGRSAIVVIAYVMKTYKMHVSDAYIFVKMQRPNINLNEEQYGCLLEYQDLLNKKIEKIIT